MELLYLTDRSIDGFSANRIARIAMAEAFASNEKLSRVKFFFVSSRPKFETSLISRKNKLEPKGVYCPFYREDAQHFKLRKLVRVFVNTPIIVCALFFKLLSQFSNKNLLIFARGDKAIFASYLFSLVSNRDFVCEIHNYEFGRSKLKDFLYKKWINRAKFVVTISNYTRENWEKFGITASKVKVLASGVDLQKFDGFDLPKSKLRKQLDLPNKTKIVMYCGQLLEWKGVDVLIDAWAFNKDENRKLIIVGGSKMDVQKYRIAVKNKNLKNIKFLGHKKSEEVPSYLKCADLLVLPNTAKFDISKYHTSPIKLFEYIAAKIPVLASSLPSIRQVVSEKEVNFFKADDPKSLYESLEQIFNNYPLALQKADHAKGVVSQYSWQSRAAKIIDFCF